MNTADELWRGRRVLVTGHTGFKGSWLALWLERLGAEVVGYALAPPTEPALFDDARVASGVVSVTGDVTDAEQLRGTIDEHRPEIVFHLAAQSIVRTSYRDPIETFRTNVLGTAVVLDALRAADACRVVVNVTSDKCYRNQGLSKGYREVDELGGSDPYSASKACAELVTESYRRSFFNGADGRAPAVATARGGNVIGGGDWSPDRIVPDATRAVISGTVLAVRNPASIRPWQHVLDCLSGYLILARRLWDDPTFAGPWNFGPDEGHVRDVGWIAHRLAELWDGRLEWEPRPDPDAPGEAELLQLDSSRARAELGWTPLLDIEATLSWTVRWQQLVEDGADPRDVSLSQLADYEHLMHGGDD